LDVQQYIELFTTVGAFGVFAMLFWRRLTQVTDKFTETIRDLDRAHREEMRDMSERVREERCRREDELQQLTERAIEIMTRLEIITVELSKMLQTLLSKEDR
jgi:hypothetical protein